MKLHFSIFKGLMLLFCMTMMVCLLSCSSDDEKTDDPGGNDKREARTLKVTIDESALTYENLTIHLTTGADYEYHQVPFGTVKVSIDDLPTSVEELKKLQLPKGMTSIQQSPYLQPILIVAALNELNEDKSEARKMLDYIVKDVKSENRDGVKVHYPGSGVTSVIATDWSQVNQYKKYDKVRSYLEGATFANNYTPEKKPYVMTMSITNNSYTADKDCFLLWLTSTQTSSKRQIAIWEYDSNNDGTFDTFWSNMYLPLLHGLAEY